MTTQSEFAYRPFCTADIETLCGWLETDFDLLVWGGPYFDFPLTFDQVSALIPNGDEREREFWALSNAAGDMVGCFQLRFNVRTGQADLGRVIIGSPFRGRGISEPLLRFALKRVFLRPEIHRLELRVYDFNAAALKAYQKHGFVIEGTRRQSVRFESRLIKTNPK